MCRYDDDPENCYTFMDMIKDQYYDEMVEWLKKREKKNGGKK